jgi:hypothetical protein
MKKERTTNCPDASGWTHSGLRKMIGCARAAASGFRLPLSLAHTLALARPVIVIPLDFSGGLKPPFIWVGDFKSPLLGS